MLAIVALQTSCNNDTDIDKDNSIFTDGEETSSDLDKWISSNYVYPYNIQVKYRLDDNETDVKYDLVPAEKEKAAALLKIVKHVWIEAYDEVWGINKTRTYVPKLLLLVGNVAYTESGMIVGQAEGGLKVTLFRVNELDVDNIDMAQLNEYYFHTMHHEFTHILNQKKAYDTAFNRITESGYVGSSWYTIGASEALQKGFITPYAMDRATEDFAELVATYVTSTAAEWEAKLDAAGDTGKPILQAKFKIVDEYMKNSWNIDLDQLREVVQRRQGEIYDLDLHSL